MEFLTFKTYKQPLLPVKNGHGYYGAIQMTVDGEKLQCHVCGKLFSNVAVHARMRHELSVQEYRSKYQLSGNTVLISEFERMRQKQAMLDLRASWTEEQRQAWANKMRLAYKARGFAKRIAKGQPKAALEHHNKRRTCPDQQLDCIRQVAEKLGKTPTLAEFIRCMGGQNEKHLIFKTYGSWSNALKILKMQPEKGGKERGKKYRKYTQESLLEMLKIYTEENRKIPTATDCKTGFLPPYEVYERHFGKFEEARVRAGVYKVEGVPKLRGR